MPRKRTKIVTEVPDYINQALNRECGKDIPGDYWKKFYYEQEVEVAAVRWAFEYCAILLKYPDGRLFVHDLVGFGTEPQNWNVLNDGVDDEYKTIEDFLNDDSIIPGNS